MARVMSAMESAELVGELFDAGALQLLREVADVEPVVFEKGMPQPPAPAEDVEILITGWGHRRSMPPRSITSPACAPSCTRQAQ